MTQAEFDQQCKDLCSYCKANSVARQRTDTREWVHDTSIEIPGTLGKRQGHAFCLASEFRNQWTDHLT